MGSQGAPAVGDQSAHVDAHRPVAADFVADRFANARINDERIVKKDVTRVLVDRERGAVVAEGTADDWAPDGSEPTG
ncbi:hypothetical protein [Streptomyces sp. NBC_00872]|uniref:hypothetical protein n=1 Tax=Streptomyces sp. NBC_00872 TaxID=2903686 RepID=UPI00386BF901|nr:hypothetical protein OG214_34495 [Streptomyces sp. NBC_00872]